MSIVTYNNRSIANISAIPGAAKSLTHIKTLTASSSSTLSFVNGSDDVVLDSTYPIYKFEFINIHPSSTGNPNFQFNMSIDGGSNYNVTKTTTYFYAYHKEDNAATTLDYDTGDDLAQSTAYQPITQGIGGSAGDESTSGYLNLFNPSSTTFVKHFICSTNSMSHPSFQASYHNNVAGYGNTQSAINAIQFKMSSGNIDSGTIKLYGIKDS